MSGERATLLQLNPLSGYLEEGLRQRFNVVRWFELGETERSAWLARCATAVRAVVAGGQVGCANELMDRLPALGIIAVNGVGLDKVDLEHARDRGVRVTSTPDVLTADVADLAVGLIIALLRAIPAADRYVRSGEWERGDRPLGHTVSGRRFGIVGLGRIGSALAERLAAFGPVAYTSRQRKAARYEFHSDVKALARASDVLVVACAATPATHHLVDAAVIETLGPDGYLVNVTRGSIVDEAAVVAALDTGRLAGAALDVFANEPHVPRALCASPRTVLTPHIASATVETRTRMADLVLANLDAFLAAAPLPSASV
ncbi:MAG TPA: 2-hydroxyacid dehydrogenase [Steroidobacteraceae bacterium]|nr:2-hydroxyacid dehydrogenase [Steroidobacteraceae bacterium]